MKLLYWDYNDYGFYKDNNNVGDYMISYNNSRKVAS